MNNNFPNKLSSVFCYKNDITLFHLFLNNSFASCAGLSNYIILITDVCYLELICSVEIRFNFRNYVSMSIYKENML